MTTLNADRVPDSACAYEDYDPGTLVPRNRSTYLRLLELGWKEETFLGKDVLDIGCNSGILSIEAHRLGAASVRSVDVQRPLVDFFGDVVARHKLPIDVSMASLDQLDAKSDGADVVLFMEVLHWVVDQGGSVSNAIAKLASLTRETLFLETPWDINEPSIAARNRLTVKEYDVAAILRELQRHFEHVQVQRFMTYFGYMRDSQRVLIKASGRRAASDVLARLGDAQPLDVSLALGPNSVGLLSSPRGPIVLKTLPTKSILARVDKTTLTGFVEHLGAAKNSVIVPPERIGDSYVVEGEDGRWHMLFAFVGDLGDHFPERRSHTAVDDPVGVAVATTKALAGMPDAIVKEFRDQSKRISIYDLDVLSDDILGALEREGIVASVRQSIDRATDYDAEWEDAIVHYDLQTGNMITDPDGRDRVIDIDLIRTGTAYSDLLCAAIYCGADATRLDDAIEELQAFGIRTPNAFDFDFSIATVIGWAQAISRQDYVLNDRQLTRFITGLKNAIANFERRLPDVSDGSTPALVANG